MGALECRETSGSRYQGCRCATRPQPYQRITARMNATIAMAISNPVPTNFLPPAQSLQRRSENPLPGSNIDNNENPRGEHAAAGRSPHCWQIRAMSMSISRFAASLRDHAANATTNFDAAPCCAKRTPDLATIKKGESRLLAIRLGLPENYGVESNPSAKITSLCTAHPCTLTSSIAKPSGARPADESLLMRKRKFTVCPAYASRLTT